MGSGLRERSLTAGRSSGGDYRGPDRRAPVTDGPTPGRVAAIAATALAVAGVAAAAMGTTAFEPQRADVAALDAVAVGLALMLTVTATLQGRATGHGSPARLATGAALIAVALLIDLHLLAGPAMPGARTAAMLLAAAWIAAAVLATPVETGRRLLLQAAATIAVLVAAGVGSWVAGAPSTLPPWLGLLTAAGWLVTTGVTVRAHQHERRRDPLATWLPWLALAMALGETLAVLPAAGMWPAVAAAVRGAGAAVMVIGVAGTLATLVEGRRAAVLRARADAWQVERDHDRVARERAHELGNAILAVEGAASLLVRHDGQLPDEVRRELLEAICDGVAHLRGLVVRAGEPGQVRDVALGEVVLARLALAEARGIRSTVTGDLGVIAMADAGSLAQVIDNLVVNAVRHGGAGGIDPVAVHVACEGGRAILQISDRGPGIPVSAREQVFEPGIQLHSDTSGAGLGLSVSRSLVRALDGDLIVDPDHRGGACLVASLPLGRRSHRRSDVGGETRPTPQERQQVRQVEQHDRQAVGDAHGAPADGPGGVVQHDPDLRGDVAAEPRRRHHDVERV